MTLLQLECFLEVAKHNSFSLAAANLYLSQPTLSRQILALEEELNAVLFVRANNTVRLSGIGQRLFPKIKAMYAAYHTASDELREIVSGYAGRLRIGVQAAQSPTQPFRETLRGMRRAAPAAELLLCHLKLEESYTALMEEKIDALLCPSTTIPPSDKLERLELEREPMCLAVPADHPNAGLPEIAHQEVSRYFGDVPFWVMDSDAFEAPLKPNLTQVFAPLERETQPRELSGPFASVDALALMADTGLGMTCVNQHCILQENPRVRLIPLVTREEHGTQPVEVALCLYWLKRNGNPMLQEFLTQLAKKLRSEPERGEETP